MFSPSYAPPFTIDPSNFDLVLYPLSHRTHVFLVAFLEPTVHTPANFLLLQTHCCPWYCLRYMTSHSILVLTIWPFQVLRYMEELATGVKSCAKVASRKSCSCWVSEATHLLLLSWKNQTKANNGRNICAKLQCQKHILPVSALWQEKKQRNDICGIHLDVCIAVWKQDWMMISAILKK